MWTRGVDRFSQHVKKFESKAVLLQTSAASELPLSSTAASPAPAKGFFPQLNLPELQIWTDYPVKGAHVSVAPVSPRGVGSHSFFCQ